MAAGLGKLFNIKSLESSCRFVISLRFEVLGRETNDLSLTTHTWWSRLSVIEREWMGIIALLSLECMSMCVIITFSRLDINREWLPFPILGR